MVDKYLQDIDEEEFLRHYEKYDVYSLGFKDYSKFKENCDKEDLDE